MEHVTYPGTRNQANSFDVPTSMQTHQQVNNQDGTFDGSITVEIQSISEPRNGQEDDSLLYNTHDATSSIGGLRSAHQQGPDQGGPNGMRSIDPTPGSSSQTGQTCGSTSNASLGCPSFTENTLPGCSSQAESADVSLLRGKHLQAHFYSNKCRVCLEKGTIPIYGSASGIGEAISLIASVDIGKEKQFPRHLCVKCYSLLQGAMKFRKMAQQTDKILKQSNYVSNKKYLEDDYYLGVNFIHDPGTKLKQELSMDSYKAEHTESQQAYDFKQAYLMLISQSTPSGKRSDGYNDESMYIKEESGGSSKPNKKFKHSNSDSDSNSKRSLEDDNDYDDFFDSEPSRKQPQRKAKRNAFKESISLFLKTEIFEESQEDVTDQRAGVQGMINLFRCEICDKEFAKVHYKKHLAAHGMIQCKVCKNAYLKINYRKHMREQHKKVLKYVCEICGKELRSKSSHHLHKLTHTNEFPFKCEICPYRGRHSDLLKTHMRSHTKDYKYLCTECPTRCLTSSHLSRHLRTHKEGDYKCATCDKAFHTMGGLTKHQQVDHLGIKNHICNICGKAFGCRKIMMKHQRQVHKRQKLKGGRMPSYLEAEKQQEATESPFN